METYTAVARREGEEWVAEVDNPPHCGRAVSRGHSRTEVQDMVTELVAILAGHRNFTVTVRFEEESDG
ncbi:MAG TPA: hypothetical protein VFN03_05670 [Trueperaceae bacterium]|nr:hypothetical protein [Trueperaceae bacterium]